jgi:hypothetical protein
VCGVRCLYSSFVYVLYLRQRHDPVWPVVCVKNVDVFNYCSLSRLTSIYNINSVCSHTPWKMWRKYCRWPLFYWPLPIYVLYTSPELGTTHYCVGSHILLGSSSGRRCVGSVGRVERTLTVPCPGCWLPPSPGL